MSKFKNSPFFLKLYKKIENAAINIPIINKMERFARPKWIRKEYSALARADRKYLYMSAARFMNINRPIPGYYFEFGCHEANTMRDAWSSFRYLFDLHYVAFDSFEGLPDMEDFDKSSIFIAGNLATEENEFIRRVTSAGMPIEKLTTVKGFYNKTLNDELAEKLLPSKAAVIYIDCDLYESTVPVLKFIKRFLQKGTIIMFDDWNCYHADPNMGERRAWSEFLIANPNCEFVEYLSTGEAKSFVCVKAE